VAKAAAKAAATKREAAEQRAATAAAHPQNGEQCAFCGEHLHRWGAHAVCSAPCGHTFGEICLRQYVQYAVQQRQTAQCPSCKTRLRRGLEDVRRLYVANQEERPDDPARLRQRVDALEAEKQVETRALAAAEGRARLAEAALQAHQARHSTTLAAANIVAPVELAPGGTFAPLLPLEPAGIDAEVRETERRPEREAERRTERENEPEQLCTEVEASVELERSRNREREIRD
jgi:hypothetical protein